VSPTRGRKLKVAQTTTPYFFAGARISLCPPLKEFTKAALHGRAGRVSTTALAYNPHSLHCCAQRLKEEPNVETDSKKMFRFAGARVSRAPYFLQRVLACKFCLWTQKVHPPNPLSPGAGPRTKGDV